MSRGTSVDQDGVTRYFDEAAMEWVAGAYRGGDHVFPTGLARMRRAIRVIQERFGGGQIVVADLGCGAGQLCVQLAELGYTTIGVERSAAMLAEARRLHATLPETVRERVDFVAGDVTRSGLPSVSVDAATALGVIGYLRDDDGLFVEAARVLKPDGLFLVSCRNRLFNMVSLGDYTLREIEDGAARELIGEIRALLREVPYDDAMRFVAALAAVSTSLANRGVESQRRGGAVHPPAAATGAAIEARQHTPKRLVATARRYGFEEVKVLGVHPHILMAGVNDLLPPNMFNALSTALDALDQVPVSLIWSSVFIGVFRKSVGATKAEFPGSPWHE